MRDQPTIKEVSERIIYALKHAHDDTYYNKEEDYLYNTPLWHAIAAEGHISKKLINPVIKLLTTTNEDSDLLNEQGMFLIGKLAEKYPDKTMKKVMSAIDKMIRKKSNFPYLYLFEVFYFVNARKYKKWFLKILGHKDLAWTDAFAWYASDLQIEEAIPVLRKILADDREYIFSRANIEGALEQLETGVNKHAEPPYCQSRKRWKEHYGGYEDMFCEKKKDDRKREKQNTKEVPKRAVKIGRNVPCLCGSGRKYKKCCLDK